MAENNNAQSGGRGPVRIGFMPIMVLTSAGAASLVSLVVDGPVWLTSLGLVVTIGALLWIIAEQRRPSK